MRENRQSSTSSYLAADDVAPPLPARRRTAPRSSCGQANAGKSSSSHWGRRSPGSLMRAEQHAGQVIFGPAGRGDDDDGGAGLHAGGDGVLPLGDVHLLRGDRRRSTEFLMRSSMMMRWPGFAGDEPADADRRHAADVAGDAPLVGRRELRVDRGTEQLSTRTSGGGRAPSSRVPPRSRPSRDVHALVVGEHPGVPERAAVSRPSSTSRSAAGR